MNRFKPVSFIALTCLIAIVVSGCPQQPEIEECIQFKDIQTVEIPPAGVRTVFQLTACDGSPMADLQDAELEILLDGESVQSEGSVGSVLTQEFNFDNYVLLLLDMSNSIVDNGNLQPMIEAAMSLVHRLTQQGHNIAIYQFAGPAYFGEVQEFTSSEELLDEALIEMLSSPGLGTTDLYGSIPKAIDILEQTGSPDVLTTRTLVLFTDGTDEAMASTSESAQQAINHSDANVFTIGLGGDVDKDELLAFGKDGFEWVEDPDALEDAFTAIVDKITNLARSHYLMGICSPRVGGVHDMQLIVTRENQTGSLTVHYNADGFDIVGCDSNLIAFPCGDQECGDAWGIMCGSCGDTEYCNEDLMCQEACGGEIECGVNQGVDCGDCSELGENFACDEFTCVDVCTEAECGTILGIDCGDCSDFGDTFFCDENHTCIDACVDAECGTVLGVDCGDCSEFGQDWACDAENACVDACADAECGTILGVECGDCAADYGPDWGCDESYTCVEACAGAECGDILGVDCGDCSEYGSNYGCDDSYTCVDACASVDCGDVLGVDCGGCDDFGSEFSCIDNFCTDVCAEAECGEISGVDCGDCDGGFECNLDNVCVPLAIPNLTWVSVGGGDFTLGCDFLLDPSCGLDEPRHKVRLTDFYIMDTEVTVEMYRACVGDGGCNASYVDTSSGCNWSASASSFEDHPLNCVTWDGMKQFCSYVGGTIASEAQWERAFRADHDDVLASYWIYGWGNSPAPSCTRVVMNEGGPGCGAGTTDAVGTMPSTSYGLSNMAGNVSEWTLDFYSDVFEDCESDECADSTGPETGSEKVVRGGSWSDFYDSAFRTAARDKEAASTTSPAIGGRCVK